MKEIREDMLKSQAKDKDIKIYERKINRKEFLIETGTNQENVNLLNKGSEIQEEYRKWAIE